jgi:hypothetical protein
MKKSIELLVVEDKAIKSVKKAQEDFPAVKIHLATNLEGGLKELQRENISYVVTDLSFPPEREYTLDVNKLITQYNAFLSKVLGKRIEPEYLTEMIKCGKGKELTEKIGIDTERFYEIIIDDSRLRKSLIKNQMFKGEFPING